MGRVRSSWAGSSARWTVDIWRPVETSKGGRRSRVSGGQQRDTSRRRALARLVLQLSRRLPSLYKSLHLAATDLVI